MSRNHMGCVLWFASVWNHKWVAYIYHILLSYMGLSMVISCNLPIKFRFAKLALTFGRGGLATCNQCKSHLRCCDRRRSVGLSSHPHPPSIQSWVQPWTRKTPSMGTLDEQPKLSLLRGPQVSPFSRLRGPAVAKETNMPCQSGVKQVAVTSRIRWCSSAFFRHFKSMIPSPKIQVEWQTNCSFAAHQGMKVLIAWENASGYHFRPHLNSDFSKMPIFTHEQLYMIFIDILHTICGHIYSM